MKGVFVRTEGSVVTICSLGYVECGRLKIDGQWFGLEELVQGQAGDERLKSILNILISREYTRKSRKLEVCPVHEQDTEAG